MGGALLAGWLDRGMAAADVCVVEPGPAAAEWAARVRVVAGADQVPADFVPDVVMLAVKPQAMAEVVPLHAGRRGAVYLSIAAGKPLAFFESLLGAAAPVVRAMPNTPAAVRRGMTVAIASAAVDSRQRDLCHGLLEAVGEVAWIEDEALMDAVTAVSGSGPAYVFHLVEALAEAGRDAGLPADLAMRLARATVAGAGELLHAAADDAATLRRNVTSPGGTTAAALEVLMAEDGLRALMARAVAAAARRSRELGG